MHKRSSKMFVATLLTLLSTVLAISFTSFYFLYIDKQIVARAQNKNQTAFLGVADTSGKFDLSKSLTLEYAKTETERETGLMHRKSLCENCGMLFIFESPSIQAFWMKNTLIPLDIIFIDQNGIILNIEHAKEQPNSLDETQYPIYKSTSEAMYVLEVNQGWSEKNNLNPGSQLDLTSVLK